jgi:hypothetical protein
MPVEEDSVLARASAKFRTSEPLWARRKSLNTASRFSRPHPVSMQTIQTAPNFGGKWAWLRVLLLS